MKKLVLGLALGVLVTSSVASAGLWSPTTTGNIWSQRGPESVDGQHSYSSNTDLGDPLGGDLPFRWSETYDDFSVGGPATIEHIEWLGMFDLDDMIQSSLDHFEITIYANAAGAPDGTVASRTLDMAPPIGVNKVSSTYFDTLTIGVMNNQFSRYAYAVDLATPISLAAGDYWISIVGNVTVATPDFPDDYGFWNWAMSDQGGPSLGLYQYHNWYGLDNSVTGSLPVDNVAFSLTGSVVPEPTSVIAWTALLGMVGGLGFFRRRRRTAC